MPRRDGNLDAGTGSASIREPIAVPQPITAAPALRPGAETRAGAERRRESGGGPAKPAVALLDAVLALRAAGAPRVGEDSVPPAAGVFDRAGEDFGFPGEAAELGNGEQEDLEDGIGARLARFRPRPVDAYFAIPEATSGS